MAILTCDYYSNARKGFVSFNAVIPSDIDVPGEGVKYRSGAFPTIYLLHGFSGNRNQWLYNSDIVNWANQYGYAVIMPDGLNRFYLDNADTGELYGEFVGRELVEFTRGLFPLSGKREDTVIAGLSMGGFGALRNGLKYSDTFGSVAALSSALITDEISRMQPGTDNGIATYEYFDHTFGSLDKLIGSDNDPKRLASERAADGNAPRLFLACGTEDFLYSANCDYHAHLDSVGLKHKWHTGSGVHDFVYWNSAMKCALEWLKGGE